MKISTCCNESRVPPQTGRPSDRCPSHSVCCLCAGENAALFLRSNTLSCANVLGHEVGGENTEQVVISNVYMPTLLLKHKSSCELISGSRKEKKGGQQTEADSEEK